jgi:uncharacterized protein (DUF1015 family)
MAIIKPFQCIRPAIGKAARIAALPYDVYNSEEARVVVKKNPLSFLRIDRAETQFDQTVASDDPRVYQKAAEILENMIANGDFVTEDSPCYYIYELTMDGRAQTGLVACVSIDEYINQNVKKHENTRVEKEQDRICHVDTCGAQTGPIFLTYRYIKAIGRIIEKNKQNDPMYDFISEDNVRHRVYTIAEKDDIEVITSNFARIKDIYIADGHHRAASAVKVGIKRRNENQDDTGQEAYNYFLSVLFPDNQLMIMDYNRVVKDLNGYTSEEFLEKIASIFTVEKAPQPRVKPQQKGEFTMLLGDAWYLCKMAAKDYESDPVGRLDVNVLQEKVFEPVLNITDPRTDFRIDFVGGIRGMEELEKRVASDCVAAFAMYPTSIDELFAVADAGMLMPPKSTWFEPKLRSGIFIHKI